MRSIFFLLFSVLLAISASAEPNDAPGLIYLATWPHHYRWIKPEGLEYFRSRISQARRDVEHALTITLDYFTTREMQERALDILQFKLDILWALLDAVQAAYR